MTKGKSDFIIKWVNILTIVLAVAVIFLGVWKSTHNDGCKRSLALPVLILGLVIFMISIIGFLGVEKKSTLLLSIYILLLMIVLTLILFFTIFAFLVTKHRSGHGNPGLSYKEYRVDDYSTWFIRELNNPRNWARTKSCLVRSEDCNILNRKYKTREQLDSAKLTAIEAGCCYPPFECGFPAVNASYYNLLYRTMSSNEDCKRYKNSPDIKCYECDSCKAGVAQYMKTEWRLVADFTVALFIGLMAICCIGVCARMNIARDPVVTEKEKKLDQESK